MSTYITEQQYHFFHQEGYLLVKDLYSKANVKAIRSIIENGLKNGKWEEALYHNENITTHIYNIFPELVDLILTEKYIKVMKALLGEDCALVLEPAIHRNAYGNWHKDSSYLSLNGETFHLNNDFLCTQTAIYLQDNHEEYGGGLSLIPKTQHLPNRFKHLYKMGWPARVLLKMKKLLGVSIFDKLDKDEHLLDIPSKAGDLIVFNYNIDHKGSTPIKADSRGDKYAIFNAFANKPHYAEQVSSCLKKIPSNYSKIYLNQNYELSDQLVEKAKTLNIEIKL